MKIKSFCLLLIATASVTLNARAQTSDEIIGKYVDAIGGKDKLSQIKTLYVESTVQVMGGDNPSSTTIVNGKGFYTQSDINGSKVVQCYTNKGGWSINPFMGSTDPAPMPAEQYEAGKDQIYVGGALADYAAKGYKAELLGKDGTNYKVKISSGKNEVVYYFDATTYLVTKMMAKAVMQGAPVDITTTLSDYQKTDSGYVTAHKIDIDLGQFQLTYLVKKVEVNKEIDPKIFDMPGK